jgi:hypothetical protein
MCWCIITFLLAETTTGHHHHLTKNAVTDAHTCCVLITGMHDEEVVVQVPDFSYDPLVGAQPDGSWRAANVAMFERVCTIILESDQEGEFNEPVARMLTRWVFSAASIQSSVQLCGFTLCKVHLPTCCIKEGTLLL